MTDISFKYWNHPIKLKVLLFHKTRLQIVIYFFRSESIYLFLFGFRVSLVISSKQPTTWKAEFWQLFYAPKDKKERIFRLAGNHMTWVATHMTQNTTKHECFDRVQNHNSDLIKPIPTAHFNLYQLSQQCQNGTT